MNGRSHFSISLCNPFICIKLDKLVFILGHLRRGIASFLCVFSLMMVLVAGLFELINDITQRNTEIQILLIKLAGIFVVQAFLGQGMIEASKDRKGGEIMNCQLFLVCSVILLLAQIIYLIINVVYPEGKWNFGGSLFWYLIRANIVYSFYEIVVVCLS
ncbi:unnamed protein product [Orchesella dallaii]|uniref:Uncharacterized protein n=1 Tax=Orchesella dallaii TaxID=48710 RepID=A0ABP1Q2Y1_9HEXA